MIFATHPMRETHRESEGVGEMSSSYHDTHAQKPSMESIEDLLKHDHYTVPEAAYLLDMSPDILRRAILARDLPAFIVNHDIISLKRHDLLEWLRSE
jgi:hypothetical protein